MDMWSEDVAIDAPHAPQTIIGLLNSCITVSALSYVVVVLLFVLLVLLLLLILV